MRSSVRELAREALSDDCTVDLYVLHQKYRISPSEALFAARFFVRVGIARQEGAHLVFSHSAKEWILDRREKFFLNTDRPWTQLNRIRLDPAQPYLPALGKVDTAFFIKMIDSEEKRR